jgi:phosphoribosylglycinamide formyltransferase-1
MKKIIIFASGNGSNAENISLKIKNHLNLSISSIWTNNPHAKVINRAENLKIPFHIFSKSQLMEGEVLNLIKNENPDLIILAGFLLKIPENFAKAFPNKIINIHPALLPNYGGKGMYGRFVHEAVYNNQEKETGITIHYVNEHYDEGQIIFQKTVDITDCYNADEISKKVHQLEIDYYPQIILDLLKND